MEWANVDISLILFGLSFIIFGIYMCWGYIREKNNCKYHAIGTVIDLREKRIIGKDKYGIKSYKVYMVPVIQYEANGRIYHKEYEYTNNRSYSKGDTIEVYYNQRNPESFIIDIDKNVLIFNVVFTVAGIIVMIIGIFLPSFFG